MSDSKGNSVERWWPVYGFHGYEASDHGRVRSYRGRRRKPTAPPRVLTPRLGKQGYLTVCVAGLYGRATMTVHRLVLLTFRGICPEGHAASHLNGDRLDNRLENLEWESWSDNLLRKRDHGTMPRGVTHHAARLSPDDVRAIRADPRPQVEIARDYPVGQSVISRIKSRKAWAHVE